MYTCTRIVQVLCTFVLRNNVDLISYVYVLVTTTRSLVEISNIGRSLFALLVRSVLVCNCDSSFIESSNCKFKWTSFREIDIHDQMRYRHGIFTFASSLSNSSSISNDFSNMESPIRYCNSFGNVYVFLSNEFNRHSGS